MRKLLFVFLICILGSCKTTIPELKNEFLLEYEAGPVAADRGGHGFVRINNIDKKIENFSLTKGSYDYEYDIEQGRIKKDTLFLEKTLGIAEIEKLLKSFSDNKFWSMKASYRDKSILDGSYERIKISIDGVEKQVSIVNYNNKKFNTIVDRIESLCE